MEKRNKSCFRAFTLIELLVVVLIIGVLTAIAIPQYQTAVQKSRYATLMPLAKSVKNAEEAILMSNGSYTEELTDLSISVPSEEVTITPKADDHESYVRASKTGLNNRLVMYLAKSSRYPNEIHCEAEQENKIAKQICLSLGASATPVAGTADSSGYDTYVLEGTGIDAGSLGGGAVPAYQSMASAFSTLAAALEPYGENDEDVNLLTNAEDYGIDTTGWTCEDDICTDGVYMYGANCNHKGGCALYISTTDSESGEYVALYYDSDSNEVYCEYDHHSSVDDCERNFAGAYDRAEAD